MGKGDRGVHRNPAILFSDVPDHLQGICLCLVNRDVSNFRRERETAQIHQGQVLSLRTGFFILWNNQVGILGLGTVLLDIVFPTAPNAMLGMEQGFSALELLTCPAA